MLTIKPKILIVGEEGFHNGLGHFLISRKYADSISACGGLPLLALDALNPEVYLDTADGLLLTGGPDIHKRRSGEIYQPGESMSHIIRSREAFDFELCRIFTNAGKPVFGIGRGMQVLNAFFGGTLHMDISVDTNYVHSLSNEPSSHNSRLTYHEVKFTTESILPFTSTNIVVNSCHHQAVKSLGEGLVTSAVASDGTIEAIEHKTLPFFGVQWHPELDDDKRVFEHFINLCKEGAK